MSSTLPWYIARSAGLVAWALLTASVVWGLMISTRAKPMGKRPKPAWMLDLHRFLGGLATVFAVLHVVALLFDSYIGFDLASVLIPFSSHWKPGAVAWGVVGLYLLLAVELTSLARQRLPRKVWRAVHFASVPLFITATLHALTAGTDTGTWLFETVAAAAVLGTAGLTGLRASQAGPRPAPAAPARPRIPTQSAVAATTRPHAGVSS